MNKRLYFWISVVLFTIVVGIMFFKGQDQEQPFFSPELKKIKADLVLYGVRYRRDARGKASQWLVTASRARFYEKKKEVDFDKVKITFQPGSKTPVMVTAKRGQYRIPSGTVSVSGKVEVKGVKGYTLLTDVLFYYPEKLAIEAPGSVKLKGDNGNELLGKDMVYLLKEHKLLLYFPRAIIKEEDAGA